MQKYHWMELVKVLFSTFYRTWTWGEGRGHVTLWHLSLRWFWRKCIHYFLNRQVLFFSDQFCLSQTRSLVYLWSSFIVSVTMRHLHYILCIYPIGFCVDNYYFDSILNKNQDFLGRLRKLVPPFLFYERFSAKSILQPPHFVNQI